MRLLSGAVMRLDGEIVDLIWIQIGEGVARDIADVHPLIIVTMALAIIDPIAEHPRVLDRLPRELVLSGKGWQGARTERQHQT